MFTYKNMNVYKVEFGTVQSLYNIAPNNLNLDVTSSCCGSQGGQWLSG